MDLKHCDKNSWNLVFWWLLMNICFCKWFPWKKHISWIDIISMYILEKKLKRYSKMCMRKMMATGKIRRVAQLAKKVKILMVTLVVQTAVMTHYDWIYHQCPVRYMDEHRNRGICKMSLVLALVCHYQHPKLVVGIMY